MAYLRCTKCGSKALTAASQCPRCAQPFNLVDARGERVKLKQCRGCGIMHRADTACHWCGEVQSTWRISGTAWRSAAAVAVMLVGVGAAYRAGPSVREFTSTLVRTANEEARRAGSTRAAAGSTTAQGLSTGEPPVIAPVAMPDSANAIVAVAAEDSITWTPAVAITWVNVRSDASRGGQVVGVIKPTTRAMLGTDRAGWRLVRSTDVSGWVDPRLFEADSAHTRGG